MMALNKDDITDYAIKKVETFNSKEDCNLQKFTKMSETTGLFFRWVTAVHSYGESKLRSQKDKSEI